MPYDNQNGGVLFRNDDKAKDEQPDYRGKLAVAGAKDRLSAWIKTSRDGKKYMSLAVTADQPAEQPAKRTYAMRRDDLGDDPAF